MKAGEAVQQAIIRQYPSSNGVDRKLKMIKKNVFWREGISAHAWKKGLMENGPKAMSPSIRKICGRYPLLKKMCQ